MVDLYVYYKVHAENTGRLAPLVRAMQAQLAASHGVSAQLKRRPGDNEGVQTWMEVYPGTNEAFGAALADAVRGAGLDGLIIGPRHVEIFTDLTSCA